MIIIIILLIWEFITLAFDDGVSLESAWQQILLSLKDSCKYSSRSQV